jgi:hypothetical protein
MRENEIGRDKETESILTTTRTFGAEKTSRGNGGMATRRGAPSSAMAARELGFWAVAAAAARRGPKGVGRRLNRGRGSPWRVRQGDGRRGMAWRGVAGLWLEFEPRTGGRRQPRQVGPTCRRQRGEGRELGRGEGIGPAGLGCAGRKGKKGRER